MLINSNSGQSNGRDADGQTKAQVKESALRLLSRREYSVRELTTRLTSKFDAALVDAELKGLIEQGLQSDERYARMMLNARLSRSHGPLRIVREIQSKGVAPELVGQVMEAAEVDWFEQAREAYERRFGPGPATDMKQRSKQFRFLQYRGFSVDQIQYAMNPDK
ncbi:regulatory protein RecX [Ketobacter sp.]